MRFFPLLALLALPFVASGCLLVAAGGAAYGAIQYEKNEAYRDFESDLPDTWDATVAALEKLGYSVPENAGHTPTEGEIDIEDTNVRVERYPGDLTRVRVRIGTFDTESHRRRAQLLLEEIDLQLN